MRHINRFLVRGIAIMVCLLSVFSGIFAKSVTAQAKSDTQEILYGDVTGDQRISVRDALLTMKIALYVAFDVTEEQKIAADVDGDGKVTITDCRMILQYCLGKISFFPGKPFVPSGHIWIVGDSMASTHETNGYVVPIMGWGVYLPDYLTDAATVHNEARSGRSAKSYLNETNYTTVMDNMDWGDYMIFAMGNNDSHSDLKLYTDPYGGSDEEESYMWYMKNYYIDPALNKGLKVILIASNKTDWAEATHRMSDEYADQGITIPCIDITELEERALEMAVVDQYGEDADMEEVRNPAWASLHGVDEKGAANSHYSEYGADLVARALVEKMEALGLDICTFIK